MVNFTAFDAALVNPTSMLSPTFDNLLAVIHSNAIDIAAGLAAAILAFRIAYLAKHKGLRTTRLRGPSGGLFGVEKVLFESPDSTALYETWYKEYGAVYEVPMMLGQRRIVLCDPKALAHFYGKDSWSYTLKPAEKIGLEKTVCGFLYFTFLAPHNV